MAAGTKQPVDSIFADTGDKDPLTGGALSAGWQSTAAGVSRRIFNWTLNRFDSAIRYLTRRGIADWDSAETYAVNDYARGTDGNVYVCIAASTNNPPASSPTQWTFCPLSATQQLAEFAGLIAGAVTAAINSALPTAIEAAFPTASFGYGGSGTQNTEGAYFSNYSVHGANGVTDSGSSGVQVIPPGKGGLWIFETEVSVINTQPTPVSCRISIQLCDASLNVIGEWTISCPVPASTTYAFASSFFITVSANQRVRIGYHSDGAPVNPSAIVSNFSGVMLRYNAAAN